MPVQPAAVVVVEKTPTSPLEVAVIATDCLLGMSITDTPSMDPTGHTAPVTKRKPTPKSSSLLVLSDGSTANRGGTKEGTGWRKTEYLFKLGRFIPAFMIVGKYYKDEEEEERRRREMQKEYDGLMDRLRKYQWDNTPNTNTTAKSKDESSLSAAKDKKTKKQQQQGLGASSTASRTEYYLQRLYSNDCTYKWPRMRI